MVECRSYRELVGVVRARKGHEVEEAAHAAGVGMATWYRALRGRMPTRSVVLHKLAAYLGVDPADLMPGGRYGQANASQDATDAIVAGVPAEVTHG
jgi:transcriptional regulator with XRE-family HTH domain